jgi:hypothetical protein
VHEGAIVDYGEYLAAGGTPPGATPDEDSGE